MRESVYKRAFQMSLGVVDPQMNKFEQVSSDHHQMLHAVIDVNYSCIPLVTQRDCAVHTYSVTAASTFMGKLQPFSYEARTEAC